MSLDRPTLAEFARHAERYGSELVYETAAAGYLEPEELGLLSLALQRIDKRWRLSRDHRTRLALQLEQASRSDAEICAAAQLSRVTLYRLRQQQKQTPDSPETPLDSAQPSRANVPKTATPARDTTRGEMKHAGP